MVSKISFSRAVNEAMSVIQAELVKQMTSVTFDKLAAREKRF